MLGSFVLSAGFYDAYYLKALKVRNEGRKRINEISFEAFLTSIGELPKLDFSSDVEMIKEHRKEVRKQREIRRIEKRKESFKKKEENKQ